MHYVDVQGARVPALGLGTWKLAGRDCTNAVAAAISMGYRHIDTAQAYGNEAEVGSAILSSGLSRDAFWLTTKVSINNLEYERVVKSTRESLKRLATDYVDLLMIHWPNPNVPLESTFAALTRLRDEGSIRYIGVSNFTASMVQWAVRTSGLFGLQIECHPWLPQKRLHSLAVDRNLLFTAYSPLARGEVVDVGVLAEIGRHYGKTPCQVALRWLLQKPNTAAIPKASSLEHLRESISVFDFELSPDEVHRIDALGDRETKRMVDPSFAPKWESR